MANASSEFSRAYCFRRLKSVAVIIHDYITGPGRNPTKIVWPDAGETRKRWPTAEKWRIKIEFDAAQFTQDIKTGRRPGSVPVLTGGRIVLNPQQLDGSDVLREWNDYGTELTL